ncbi:TPA: serine/threonine protein kinase [Pseudomonas aeruginosa]|uniref:protein kinase domain-containing protein n=1 Tax=Pseudomonas aeruginosa TaxID=287 RepID=UPI002DD6E860|nr:serine/threonine protein kinase [Pseudomonas aeruginosa]HBO8874296.1 serine/threonine protein kinase [Pseudomonas aeruginosa]HBO8881203.1 serine/threonine protein kinase [Pseudomonas aeruginosa]HBO8911772.1 serine/threonine protein kinase [Pseudomonas aeruginosa]HBO8922611.1 serine/threonine protein kinase [Pseudomonas aeruginosa]
MSNAEHQTLKPLVDEYNNVHQMADELARGGQGVVYRTKDADLAVKQPLDAAGQPDKNANLRERFQHVRLLPIPRRIPVSLPLAILRDEPGYVMRLLNGMKPFASFDLDGRSKKKLEDQSQALPQWLTKIPDKDLALRLLHYAQTGSTRRRSLALAKCAAILARLHSAGLVYGDISTNNAFIGEDDTTDVWLIDADNMRLELPSGGVSVYTPGYGAPEVVQGRDQSRPRTDCWAFAVMTFKLLALCHPFIGKKVLEPEDEEDGWDADPAPNGTATDLNEQAFAGFLPFVDDEDDDSNEGVGGLPRVLVATEGLRRLFQETFGAGRELPHRRPTMAFWTLELARAADQSLDCLECGMSHFADEYAQCPYCGAARPAFIRVKTPRWEILIPGGATEFRLPQRLFHPFSFEYFDNTAYEAMLNCAAKTAVPVRGTLPFPDNLTFEFVEGCK